MSQPKSRTAKQDLRRRLLTGRSRRSPIEVERAGHGLADQMAGLIQQAGASTVAAYLSVAAEPETGPLIERLHAQGITVLLPLVDAEHDLDWAAFGPNETRPGRFGLIEPAGARLGVTAIAAAEVICCPGLAGSIEGHRLGRGGGFYDRALARAQPGALRCLLLYDDEVLTAVPTDSHDQQVDVLVTPTRTITTSASRH
ncbi:MAG: 5-formyltetrahydrofolate cyclo-ligase [Nocardioidaceae bacterium]|nr:5-formyltetrahydrofolate cyclo-ligase [Nocardioidaceae bacterium]